MKIGIPGYIDDEHFGAHINYLEFIRIVGSPVILSPGQSVEGLDGILLPGGADVDNLRNGAVPSFRTGNPNPFLDYFDVNILPRCLGVIPVFGICRGLQTINVSLGGTLFQNIDHPYSSHYTDLVHAISVVGEKKQMRVNSYHHQAINKLGNGINVEATEPSTGIVEAISGNKFFAVQWHPERMLDSYSINKFKELFR